MQLPACSRRHRLRWAGLHGRATPPLDRSVRAWPRPCSGRLTSRQRPFLAPLKSTPPILTSPGPQRGPRRAAAPSSAGSRPRPAALRPRRSWFPGHSASPPSGASSSPSPWPRWGGQADPPPRCPFQTELRPPPLPLPWAQAGAFLARSGQLGRGADTTHAGFLGCPPGASRTRHVEARAHREPAPQ